MIIKKQSVGRFLRKDAVFYVNVFKAHLIKYWKYVQQFLVFVIKFSKGSVGRKS